jgi:phosphatidylglycerol:prolipoprotein diacylglycerol transferase
MTYPQIDPVIVHIGPLAVRWYGVMYILGFIAAYFIIRFWGRRRQLSLTNDDVADLLFYLAIGVIVGGRLGYVLFYNFSYYLANPLRILFINQGGMSFHGGLVGVTIAAILFARKRQLPFGEIADLGTLAAPMGLMFGRIGNFINAELYGRVTDLPWGMIFPGAGAEPRHPSQLYEAFLEGPLLMVILWTLAWRKVRRGVVAWSFVGFYGLFRFLVEFVREPDQQLGFLAGGLSMGQLLSLPMAIIGISMALITMRRAPR